MWKRFLFKVLFGLAAAALTVMLFALSNKDTGVMFNNKKPNIVAGFEHDEATPKPSIADVGATVMHKPHYTGEDNKNRLWELHADVARQSGAEGAEQVLLENVFASATNEKGKTLSFLAGEGVYGKQNNVVELRGNVHIEGLGLVMATEQVVAHLADRQAYGSQPVMLKSGLSVLQASSFSIVDNGSVIRLQGGVKGVLYPRELSAKEVDAETTGLLLNTPETTPNKKEKQK